MAGQFVRRRRVDRVGGGVNFCFGHTGETWRDFGAGGEEEAVWLYV